MEGEVFYIGDGDGFGNGIVGLEGRGGRVDDVGYQRGDHTHDEGRKGSEFAGRNDGTICQSGFFRGTGP